MKKVFLILVALIGLGFSTLSENSSLIEPNPKDCYCPRCDVKLEVHQEKEAHWADCYVCGGDGYITCGVKQTCNECEGTGKQKCQGWESCSSCGGTGCKNGYTTNGGKNCAYGYCSYCSGKGGKYVTGRWTSCNNCSMCRGTGVREVLTQNACRCNSSTCKYNSENGRYGSYSGYNYRNILKCPKCGEKYSGC